MLVYVHGNCQAPAIATLLASEYPDWTVRSYEVFSDKIIDEFDTFRDLVARADIIVSQPIHDGYRDREELSLRGVRSAAKATAPIVVFPSMFFDGQLVGWRSVAVPGYGMPYNDILLFHLVSLGMGVDRIASIILDDELYPRSFIAQEIALSIAEMRRREAEDQIDTLLSPFLEQFGTVAPLFNVINHPGRAALSYIANAILSSLGYKSSIPFTGEELITYPRVPLTGSVRRFLASEGQRPEWAPEELDQYHLPTETLTRLEYCVRATAHLRTRAKEDLMQSLQLDHVRPFLERLAAAAPHIPGIRMWQAA